MIDARLSVTWNKFCLRFLFFILSVVSIQSIAQEFAPIGAEWYFTQKFVYLEEVEYFHFVVEKDTIIDGKEVRKIVKNSTPGCSTRPLVEFMFENDSNEVMYYDGELQAFQKLWDFNAVPGDQWTVFGSIFSPLDTIISYKVDSVSIIEINGHLLKQWFVTFHHGIGFEFFDGNSVIIENIGDIKFFFPWNGGACDLDYADGLRCYEDPSIGLYETGIADSCNQTGLITSSTDVNQERVFDIYPNPASELIYLSIPASVNTIFGVHVINSMGVTVHTCEVGVGHSVDVSGLSGGLYYLTLYDGNQQMGVRKFIKY